MRCHDKRSIRLPPSTTIERVLETAPLRFQGRRAWTVPTQSMSITVEVSLLSGKRAAVQASLDETVEVLTQRAQIALGVGKGRLLDSSGVVLDGCAEIANSQLQNGDSLTLHNN